MNCFDWQNRTSEYLDGSLMGPAKREADEHIESCELCGARYKHYRLILASIANQPRTALPVAVRKAPLSTASHLLASAGSSSARGRTTSLFERARRWLDIPWYIRVPAEGAGIVVLIILAISAGPRMRNIYERKIEKSLTEFTDGLNNDGDSNLGATSDTASAAAAPAAPQTVSETSDDYASSEDGDAAGDNEDDAPVKAGASETWRFNLKTDSPHDVRSKIVKILTDLKIPANTPGIGGIEAPGGIQFDLIVPQSVIPDLKQALEKIAPPPPKDLEDSPFGETFTWYKRKSKTPVPKGQTHVVIWLAQV